jgi:hypothetical protein
MRVTESSRFPHPVLSPNSGDFATGEFDLRLAVIETPSTGALTIEHDTVLSEPAVRKLVESGRAVVGCFVRCDDTYFTELRRLSWPRGKSDFVPGTLLNRVTLRPLIWLEDDLPEWSPESVHSEFELPISLANGDVLAIGSEYVLSVGPAKLAPLESIFELKKSDEIPEGIIRLDPDADRILILVAPETFETVSLLREQHSGLPVLMNGVYLPAVMELLEMLRSGTADYADRRWFSPFAAKCDAKAIDIQGTHSLLDSAQELLERPSQHLTRLVTDAGGDA